MYSSVNFIKQIQLCSCHQNQGIKYFHRPSTPKKVSSYSFVFLKHSILEANQNLSLGVPAGKPDFSSGRVPCRIQMWTSQLAYFYPLYPKSQLFSPNASLVSMILAGCYCSFCFANILFLLIVEEYYF